MDLGLSYLLFTTLWRLSSAIQCYRCTPEFNAASPFDALCDHFNASDPAFYQECQYSTMCRLSISSIEIDGEVTITTERGCAAQTWPGEQVKVDRHWKSVKNIHEAYAEGCMEIPANDLRLSRTIKCYCRGDYCNTSTKLLTNHLNLFVLLELVIVYYISHN